MVDSGQDQDQSQVDKTIEPVGLPKSPEIGDNPAVDRLRTVPERLGFRDTAELSAERIAIADWLKTHSDDVSYALDCEDDTPELAALQLHWGAYVAASERIVDESEGDQRLRAMLGMLIDHAMVYYDAGLTHQFWERVEDIRRLAEGENLQGEVPEISAVIQLD